MQQSTLEQIAQSDKVTYQLTRLYEPVESCYEKHQALKKQGIEATPLKTMYAVIDWQLYMFVMPDSGEEKKFSKRSRKARKQRRDAKVRIEEDIVKVAFEQAKLGQPIDSTPYVGQDALPQYATKGYCTPLIPKEAFTQEDTSIYGPLKAIFIQKPSSELKKSLVDIPSEDKSASIQVEYGWLADQLKQAYQDKVFLTDFSN
jgi:hypothetical protein